MRDQPTGEQLLACARRALKDKLLPALDADQRYTLLMVMNAMSIAERQLHEGEAPAQRELEELQALLGSAGASLADANREFAKRLREGAADPGQPARAAMFAQLRRTAVGRLRESNPKLLKDQTGAKAAG